MRASQHYLTSILICSVLVSAIGARPSSTRALSLEPVTPKADTLPQSPTVAPEPQAPSAPAVNVIYVNSSADTSPCDSGVWTLRCAIDFADSAIDVTDIRFTVYTVVLSDSLPTITHAGTWIDGVNGSNTVIRPLIDGSQLPFSIFTGYNIFTIAADDVTISNLQMINGAYNGNNVEISSGKNVAIAYNDLGIQADSSACPALSGGSDGVYIPRNSAGTSAVNVAYIYGNTISCHGGAGVEIRDATVSVGLDRNGSAVGNYIGTTDDGRHAAANHTQGVYVGKSSSTWITVTIANNTISGNSQYGIYLAGNGTDNTTICDNIIGLNYYTNTLPYAVPNGLGGVDVIGAANTRFGSCQALALQQSAKVDPSSLIIGQSGNIIAGNLGPGLHLRSASQTSLDGDSIGGNSLALSLGFTQDCIGNQEQGILLDGDTHDSALYPAAVACNDGAGVATAGQAISETNNLVAPTVIAFNSSLPIDRANDGVTRLNYPTIELVNTATITPVISGHACGACEVYLYAAIGDPGAAGGGGIKIGHATSSLSGYWEIQASPAITRVVPALSLAGFSAFSTDIAGSLYEMRPRPQVFLPLALKH